MTDETEDPVASEPQNAATPESSDSSAAADGRTRGGGDAGAEQEPAISAAQENAGSIEREESPARESADASEEDLPALEPPSPAPTGPSAPVVDRRKTPRGPRPSLSEEREPVFHDAGGFRLRLEPPDLARLRELPGAKGKTDRELGELFFNGQSARLLASIADDVEPPADVRVVVDPYSRQAFLAVGRTIRGIVSF